MFIKCGSSRGNECSRDGFVCIGWQVMKRKMFEGTPITAIEHLDKEKIYKFDVVYDIIKRMR